MAQGIAASLGGAARGEYHRGYPVTVNAEREQILDLFISSVEDIVRANEALERSQRELAEAHEVDLDEVLHGTNAADRREASRRILHRLRATGAVGLSATHDPVIADTSAVAESQGTTVRTSPPEQIHFSCEVERHSGEGKFGLKFDYRAKPGPARESNALDILELMGVVKPPGR